MQDGAARAVLREAWLRGHRSVELRCDGKRTIFVCNRCDTRCYSDGALADHLKGNLHARLTEAAAQSSISRTSGPNDGRAKPNPCGNDKSGVVENLLVGREGGVGTTSTNPVDFKKNESQLAPASAIVESVKGPLHWIGSGELYVSTQYSSATPLVEASWFCWRGKAGALPERGWQGTHAGAISHAVVVFPYSDMIGRGGDWRPWFSVRQGRSQNSISINSQEYTRIKNLPVENATSSVMGDYHPYSVVLTAIKDDTAPANQSLEIIEPVQTQQEGKSSAVSKEAASRVLRRGWKRKQGKVLERLCFICHQRMSPGKDVAALMNMRTGQMVCGSRNRRGVFHVYHSSCLIDWTCFCEVKSLTGVLEGNKKLGRRRGAVADQSLKLSCIQEGGGPLGFPCNEGTVFCPECQGTGARVRGSQLECPRYRLAQVFDWILELIQARKAWADCPGLHQGRSPSGLLFRSTKDLQGMVQSRGHEHCYSGCSDLLPWKEST